MILTVALSYDEVLPDMDKIVTETALTQELFDDESRNDDDSATSLEQARAKIAEMTRMGKDDAACRKLGSDTKKQVEDSVKTSQKVLDALPDGSACTKAHDEVVDKATKTQEKADKAHKAAVNHALEVCNAEVEFPKFRLGELSPGDCSTFFNTAAYKGAAEACNEANKKREAASGAKDQADKALKDTKKLAAEDLSKCLCKAQQENKDAVDAATKAHSGLEIMGVFPPHHVRAG